MGDDFLLGLGFGLSLSVYRVPMVMFQLGELKVHV